MATAHSAGDKRSPTFFSKLWDRWLQRVRRNQARYRSQVKFRLTREGFHFLGLLLFIFVGAVIREFNLLILLAGSMIGLMVLQWRFNSRALDGLTLERRLPRHAIVGHSTSINLTVYNPKQMLGAWLVLVEDPLLLVLPKRVKLEEKGVSLVDEVRARGQAGSKYALNFLQRGEYQIGPSTISTRFPTGLGRGWRTLDNADTIIAHPRVGHLKPAARLLFEFRRQGQTKSSSQAGISEGDFYGLRPWATGDSKRWIHWRTTARLGELAVRQFEQQQHRELTVLLDLQGRREQSNPEFDQRVEEAVSFVATLASTTAYAGRDRLSAGIAGAELFLASDIRSITMLQGLMDKLAVAALTKEPALADAIRSLSVPLMSNPNLVVVSTRDSQIETLRQQLVDSVGRRLMARLNIRWFNVIKGDLEDYFQWT